MDAVERLIAADTRLVEQPPMVEGDQRCVLFANNNPGMVRDELFASFVELSQYDIHGKQHIGGFMTHRSGACISIFRNQVVERFLNDSNMAWLWFVDSDIQLRPDTLERLMEHADPETCPIIGGNYFMSVGSGTIVMSAFFRKKFADGSIKMAPIWEAKGDWPRNKLVKCDGLGMGCTLIHRSVLEAMKDRYGFPEPWFAQQLIGGVVHGEDLTFCHRAKEMGYPVFVHTGIEVGHVKTTILDSEHLRLRRD